MRDVGRKFSEAGAMVLDFCAGTCSTGKAWLLHDQHRKFVECDIDPEVLSGAKLDLVLTLASQVLNSGSDFSCSGEVEVAPNVVTDEIGALSARKKALVWEVPPVLDARKVTLGRILHFLSTLYGNYCLYKLCRQIFLSLWSPI